MSRRPERPALQPKKRPVQQRSKVTFDAIVEACTGLLSTRGYARTTTNHIAERAGVNIASLYEYFPGKDAIVAQVAERLVDRVLARLADAAASLAGAPADEAVGLWIERIHEIVGRERQLVAVFLYQVPYTQQLEPIQAVEARLLELSRQMRGRAGGFVRRDLSDPALQLLINLVTSTILQCVLAPSANADGRALLGELARRVEEWVRAPRRGGRGARAARPASR